MVVVDVVGVAADLVEVLLHVDGELELNFDDIDEHLFGDGALLVEAAAQGDKGVD